jgi:hypothetical protein
MSKRKVLFWWLIVSLGLAGFVSPYASQLPDGLERIACNLGFIHRESTFFRSPAPDYSWQRSIFEKLRASVAGLIGVAIVFAVTILLAKALTAAQSRHRTRGNT